MIRFWRRQFAAMDTLCRSCGGRIAPHQEFNGCPYHCSGFYHRNCERRRLENYHLGRPIPPHFAALRRAALRRTTPRRLLRNRGSCARSSSARRRGAPSPEGAARAAAERAATGASTPMAVSSLRATRIGTRCLRTSGTSAGSAVLPLPPRRPHARPQVRIPERPAEMRSRRRRASSSART